MIRLVMVFFLYLSQCSLSFLDLLVYKFQQIRKMFGYFFKTVFFILQLLFLISWLHCLLGCLILFFISLMLNWLFSLVFHSPFLQFFCISFAILSEFIDIFFCHVLPNINPITLFFQILLFIFTHCIFSFLEVTLGYFFYLSSISSYLFI